MRGGYSPERDKLIRQWELPVELEDGTVETVLLQVRQVLRDDGRPGIPRTAYAAPSGRLLRRFDEIQQEALWQTPLEVQEEVRAVFAELRGE